MDNSLKQRSLQQSLIGKSVAAMAVYAVFYAIFGGMARYGLAAAHALFVNNVPGVSAFALFGAYYLHALARREISRFMLIALFVIVFYAVYALAMPNSLLQAAMGFYIWGSFLLGVLVCIYEEEGTLFRFMIVFWAVGVFGVLLNHFVDYPWIGASYDVAGTQMEIARSWGAEGIERLPGFSRDSYAVAGHTLLACACIVASRKYSRFLKVIVYALSCLAIVLTTSKTELGLILALPCLLFAYWGLKRLWPQARIAFHFARSVIVLLVCLVVLLPLALSTHRQIKMTDAHYGFLTGDTVIERMTQMWPDAFDLLEKGGNPLFGRGVGGIGTGLSMMDPKPETVNSADNLFVYVYVEAGVFLAVPFFISFFKNLGYLYERNPYYFEIIWVLSICVLGVSIMEASVEEPVMALFLGFLVARGYVRPRHLSATEPV